MERISRRERGANPAMNNIRKSLPSLGHREMQRGGGVLRKTFRMDGGTGCLWGWAGIMEGGIAVIAKDAAWGRERTGWKYPSHFLPPALIFISAFY